MADGTLKVGTITTSSGSGTITIGQSGETVSFPTGVNLSGNGITNTPAFHVYLSGNQNITSATTTKVQFDTENFDTNNAFDTSTYTFTVPSGEAGKYKFYFDLSAKSNSNDVTYIIAFLYKNGSIIKRSETNSNSTANAQFRVYQVITSATLDLSVGDYIEAYAYINGTSPFVQAETGNRSHFEGYKLL